MFRFLIKWFISFVALLVVVHVFSGVSAANITDTIIMALVLGLLNTFLRPILGLISFPITVLTLGLFTLVLNGAMFYLATKLVHGFYVAGFGSAILAALLYSLVTFLINVIIVSENEERI
jgi:putative membrane protein